MNSNIGVAKIKDFRFKSTYALDYRLVFLQSLSILIFILYSSDSTNLMGKYTHYFYENVLQFWCSILKTHTYVYSYVKLSTED